jgi:hypothetical protein
LEAFKYIGYALGKFLFVDPILLSGSHRRMGKMLVQFNMFEGLPIEIEVEWRDTVFQQRLDYMGVSFGCSECKNMGHLRHQCRGEKNKVAQDFFDVLGDIEAADTNISSEVCTENISTSAMDCNLNSSKHHICPNFNSSLSVSYESGKKTVGVQLYKTDCVSCEGFGSDYKHVCEEPTLDILKSCEVGSHLLIFDGLLGLGRV